MSFLLSWERSWQLPTWAVLALAAYLFFFDFAIALHKQSRLGYACAYLSISSCACAVVFFCEDGGRSGALLSACLFGGFFGVVFPFLCAAIALKESRRQKRIRAREMLRSEKFILPDKDNTFLQDRLKDSLCVKPQVEIAVEDAFELTYVRKTLQRLKGKNLSPADRIELDKISSEITQLCFEKSVTDAQLRVLNSHFARVLKLAAKYAV